MENTSLISTIIATAGGFFTSILGIFISNAILKAKRNRDNDLLSATKRIEGGWSGLLEDWQDWAAHVEVQLKECRGREDVLKAQLREIHNELARFKHDHR